MIPLIIWTAEATAAGAWGSRNIHKRLSLIYGNRFSLHFYNSDKGACVEILLPDEEIRPAAEMNFSADSNKLADK